MALGQTHSAPVLALRIPDNQSQPNWAFCRSDNSDTGYAPFEARLIHGSGAQNYPCQGQGICQILWSTAFSL